MHCSGKKETKGNNVTEKEKRKGKAFALDRGARATEQIQEGSILHGPEGILLLLLAI